MIIYNGQEAYTHEELLDEFYGPKGTPKRDAFEASVEQGVREYREKKERKRLRREKRKKLFNTLFNTAAML